jgi:TonB family protein
MFGDMRRVILVCLLSVCFLHGQDEQSSARMVRTKVMPPYPVLARAANISGVAKLLVDVSSRGTVESVHIIGGHPLLAKAAADAVRNWKWEASTHDTQETVEVKFRPDK